MIIKSLKTTVGIILILISFKTQAQTQGPLEIKPSNSGSTLLVGRKDGSPSVKSSQSGSGHLILDSEFGKYVSVNHYTSDNVVLGFGGGSTGIGTTNPKSKFHIYQGLSGGNPHGFSALTVEGSEHSMISILTPNDKTAYYGFADTDDDFVGGMQYEHSNDKLVFRTNNHTSNLIINSNGNVGIGTNNSSWRLAVNGKILAKEIKVQTNWADFVFYEDYELPTLQEVEDFIKDNGHLKDIPNEKEVEENGVFLGDINSKLLQKIEELTLYTIQQEKKIQELERENKEMKVINLKLLELQSRLEKLESKK
ncbi:hypothetical protein [Flammeovirga sp. SJP92]|uniref:hypothetical protein n=1 Tax=Flammeovirga sp. SJP92 TaxID=1775430 RepID=UPI000786C709|nr:hypothetical protein [Flammeovirga sp. SJP92]KXX66869.1 hypothetical protein AVL50_30525 [Flammeovirga sp. SJP92]